MGNTNQVKEHVSEAEEKDWNQKYGFISSQNQVTEIDQGKYAE